MANVCYVPLSYLFIRGQGVKIFSLCLKEYRKQDYIFPVVKMNKLYKVIDLIIGLIFGSIFAIGIILVITIFFAVLIPSIFYFTVREVLKQLTKK